MNEVLPTLTRWVSPNAKAKSLLLPIFLNFFPIYIAVFYIHMIIIQVIQPFTIARKTAPAAISLPCLVSGWCSVLYRSSVFSMLELTSSRMITKNQLNKSKTVSVALLLRKNAKGTIKIDARHSSRNANSFFQPAWIPARA